MQTDLITVSIRAISPCKGKQIDRDRGCCAVCLFFHRTNHARVDMDWYLSDFRELWRIAPNLAYSFTIFLSLSLSLVICMSYSKTSFDVKKRWSSVRCSFRFACPVPPPASNCVLQLAWLLHGAICNEMDNLSCTRINSHNLHLASNDRTNSPRKTQSRRVWKGKGQSEFYRQNIQQRNVRICGCGGAERTRVAVELELFYGPLNAGSVTW